VGDSFKKTKKQVGDQLRVISSWGRGEGKLLSKLPSVNLVLPFPPSIIQLQRLQL
jgi:nucleotidyltransferase/DNA polymerase involved in DNA repair